MFTVADAVKVDGSLHVLAGSTGLSRKITSVTIMDIPDIADWLTGFELLIGGVLFENTLSKEFIDTLIVKDVAGIVTKSKFTERLPQEVFSYCDEVGFPILLAPGDMNWGQVMNPIIRTMVGAPYRAIEDNQHFHQELMNSVIAGESLSKICSTTATGSKLGVAIADSDLYLVGASDNLDWKLLLKGADRSHLSLSATSQKSSQGAGAAEITTSATIEAGLRVFAYPVEFNQTRYGWILVTSLKGEEALQGLELTQVQTLSLFVALHFTRQNEISSATRKFNSLLLEVLLSEAQLTPEGARRILSPLKKKIHSGYYFVFLSHEEFADSMVTMNSRMSLFQGMCERNILRWEHIIMFEHRRGQLFLIPDSLTDIEALVLKIRELYVKALHVYEVPVGVSGPMPLSDTARGLSESMRAADYARRKKASRSLVYYSDLGVIRFLIDNEGNLDANLLTRMEDMYLSPLVAHDTQYGSELRKTLETYINNNRSKVLTEQQLCIHKNTLRARIEKINKILSCDVDTSEDFFNIQFALKIDEVLGRAS
ncbi:MAG: PucR family transcriptional regulator ligand-binding domain-containing protein [Actinomycetaceae bacterium]|nr:PucR family transcriptional regulator ligand-binding domain-containing protein [Actinomycetaceae bacterium]